jgi:hypothetical protein
MVFSYGIVPYILCEQSSSSFVQSGAMPLKFAMNYVLRKVMPKFAALIRFVIVGIVTSALLRNECVEIQGGLHA